jgi:hypothetical protein
MSENSINGEYERVGINLFNFSYCTSNRFPRWLGGRAMSAGSLTSHETLTGDLASFLDEVKIEHAPAARGRLIFALDATGSRQPTWDMAASLTSSMIRETQGLDLQLVYFRGEKECQASGWVSDQGRLVKMMTKIMCQAGETQIAKVLAHAKSETTKLPVNALVFIGDAMEENPDVLVTKARELGIPLFMFQEGQNSRVESIFQDIARVTGGAHARFDAGAARQLGELLKAVAAFATGGLKALEGRKDAASTLLLGRLRGESP